MKPRSEILATSRYAAASDGTAAVLLVCIGDDVHLWKYAPSSAGTWKNRHQIEALIKRAKAKLERDQ